MRLVLFSLAAFAAIASGQTTAPVEETPFDHFMEKFDSNSDGVLSEPEFDELYATLFPNAQAEGHAHEHSRGAQTMKKDNKQMLQGVISSRQLVTRSVMAEAHEAHGGMFVFDGCV